MKHVKRMLATLLTLVLLLSLSCIVALAAAEDPEVSGIYGLSSISGVTLTALDKSGNAVTVDNTTNKGAFYPAAEQVKVTLTGATAGKYYMFFALTEETVTPPESAIQFVDQATAEGTVSCNVYPMTLSAGQTYYIYVSSNDTDGTIKQVGSFTYYAPYTLGDVNDDGICDVEDALQALRIAARLYTPTETEKKAADVTKDGVIDVEDALQILRRAANLITEF